MLKIFMILMGDTQVKKRYVKAGCAFGDAVSYLYIGECDDFASLLHEWEIWEEEYAKRWYITLPIDDFIDAGGYGKILPHLGTKRKETESPIFHAQVYRKKFLGKVPPTLDISALVEPEKCDNNAAGATKVQMGTYTLPSTKDGKEE